jgi:hypothetical protein
MLEESGLCPSVKHYVLVVVLLVVLLQEGVLVSEDIVRHFGCQVIN